MQDESRKNFLKKYPRDGSFRTEAPKVNAELVPAMTEIGTKRDQHFILTQNCPSTALAALGSAISMILKKSENGMDGLAFVEILTTGRLLADVFHQQIVCRKSFITPVMQKSLKTTSDATVADEWLYDQHFRVRLRKRNK